MTKDKMSSITTLFNLIAQIDERDRENLIWECRGFLLASSRKKNAEDK